MDLTVYIRPELLILIPVLYLIGYFIKKSKVKDERIPLILTVCGIFLATLWIISQAPLTTSQAWGIAIFAGITQGVLTAGVAVLGSQILIQGSKTSKDILISSIAELINLPNSTTTTTTETTAEAPVEIPTEKEEPPKTS